MVFNIGENIFPIVWEVTEAMELFDIQVVSLTSNGANENQTGGSIDCAKQK